MGGGGPADACLHGGDSEIVATLRRFYAENVNINSYFLFQPVIYDWCNKGCGMCYPVCGMMHIKEPLLLIGKSSPCGSSGFLSCYLNGPLQYV